jgi:hypothetical protein
MIRLSKHFVRSNEAMVNDGARRCPLPTDGGRVIGIPRGGEETSTLPNDLSGAVVIT